MKLRIHTKAPTLWSIRKRSEEFGASRYMAKKSKGLRSSQAVLAETTAKVGKTMSASTIQEIDEFYNSDSNSRIMPGMKDTITVKVYGERTKVQKRLLLFSLKELHALFKESHPEKNVSFSAFAKLRPKHCILAGGNGTHSVCVCTIHQNCKLMLDAINVQKLTEKYDKPIRDYKDCLNFLTCEPPTPDCYLDNCDNCPDISKFSTLMTQVLNDASIFRVQYSSWTATDRSTLQTLIVGAIDFIEELCNKLTILKPHSFVTKQQSQFIVDRKNNLSEGEVAVGFDFSENLKYVVQDASQAFHFNNEQCTVFPVVYYYKEGAEIQHKSCVFLSESVKHNMASVYTIQTKLIPEIKSNVGNLRKVIYMTDGAKQHFKNRF